MVDKTKCGWYPNGLQWPVWTPANSIGTDLRLTITYPDYPIHIPTLTLRRITAALAARQRRGTYFFRNDCPFKGIVQCM